MLGAIAGDIIGSVYERYPIKTRAFVVDESRRRLPADLLSVIDAFQARFG
jgi:hypothetical protein